jgi:hypothetical protein
VAERRSPYHGLSSDGHGPDEHGLGGLASPEDPRDFAITDHPAYAAALATTFPAAWLEPNTAPSSNQGTTPQCVAYSAANDQGHMDRPESGAFPAFDRSKFFAEIGGGPTAPTSARPCPAGSISATRSPRRQTTLRPTRSVPTTASR